MLYIKYLAEPARRKDLTTRTYFPEMEQLAADALIFYNLTAVSILFIALSAPSINDSRYIFYFFPLGRLNF